MSLSIKFCDGGGLCFWRVGAADDRVIGPFDDFKAQQATFLGDEKDPCFYFLGSFDDAISRARRHFHNFFLDRVGDKLGFVVDVQLTH
jgi:hypothetical protein